MSTLRAGSYLALLSNPAMDLMDVVEEQAPLLRKKEKVWNQEVEVLNARRPAGDQEWETINSYRIPITGISDRIEYECTNGLRFSNCSQRHETFYVTPNEQTNEMVFAHNGSSDPEAWDEHAHLATYLLMDGQRLRRWSSFGLLPWDFAIYNELWPGYPGPPVGLINDDHDPLDIDEELVRAYDTIRPAVTSDMSLLVTLAELKDVKSLFTEPIAFANSVIHTLGRKSAGKWTFAEIFTDPDVIPFIAKSIAKGHLYTEFGLKQTTRDISALFSTFWSLDNTVRTILSQTGSNTRHYSVPVFTRDEYVDTVEYQDYNWIIAKHWRSVLNRKFVVTMKYTAELVDAYGQPISPRDTELVRLGAAMDKLGVNLNPAILWDLVPFSFVVDYFVHIGDWLERFKRNNLNFTFGVEDSCYSVKREIETEGTTTRYTAKWNGREQHPDNPLSAIEERLGSVKFHHYLKTYDRVRFVPSCRMLTGLELPDFTLPNIGQLKIMGSLLTTNLPIFGRRG